MNETTICPACAHEICEDCTGVGCACDHDLVEDCGHDWDFSCPPCWVCGGCPECGNCDCHADAEDFYDDNEDDTMKDGYA